MKQYLIIVFCFTVVLPSAYSQIIYSNSFVFDINKSDSLKSSYVHATSDGNSIITLYNDTTYDFDVDSVDEYKAEFSCGHWRMENDSTIFLQSDKGILQNVFSRRPRLFVIDKYSFLDFIDRKYIIQLNQNLKSLIPPIPRSRNFQ